MAATSCELELWRDLRGKIVMVTGASAGLGREFCIDLAKAGCKIIAAARRTDRLKSLCDEINNMKEISDDVVHHANRREENADVLAVAVELDICAEGPTIEASVQKAWEAFGRIDVLINNAGVRGPIQGALDLSENEWEKAFKTNVTGSWLVSKYVCRHMVAFNEGGSIINISSVAAIGRICIHGAVAYISSKTALNAMTKAMTLELGKHKIKVNSICPGIFQSEITEGLMQKKWLKNVVSKTVPLKDFGTTDPALTSLIRYLIHGSSEYVTGNIFIVDAGYTLASVPLFSSL